MEPSTADDNDDVAELLEDFKFLAAKRAASKLLAQPADSATRHQLLLSRAKANFHMTMFRACVRDCEGILSSQPLNFDVRMEIVIIKFMCRYMRYLSPILL